MFLLFHSIVKPIKQRLEFSTTCGAYPFIQHYRIVISFFECLSNSNSIFFFFFYFAWCSSSRCNSYTFLSTINSAIVLKHFHLFRFTVDFAFWANQMNKSFGNTWILQVNFAQSEKYYTKNGCFFSVVSNEHQINIEIICISKWFAVWLKIGK